MVAKEIHIYDEKGMSKKFFLFVLSIFLSTSSIAAQADTKNILTELRVKQEKAKILHSYSLAIIAPIEFVNIEVKVKAKEIIDYCNDKSFKEFLDINIDSLKDDKSIYIADIKSFKIDYYDSCISQEASNFLKDIELMYQGKYGKKYSPTAMGLNLKLKEKQDTSEREGNSQYFVWAWYDLKQADFYLTFLR